MKKILSAIGILFTVLAIAFSVLPMGTIAFLPIGTALIFCLILLKKSNSRQKTLPNVLLFICVLSSAFVLGKTLFIRDKVEKDTQFERQKIEIKQEAKKELEDLEKDLE